MKTAAALLAALSLATTAPAQSVMSGVDLESPAMTMADMTRADVETILATPPVDLSGARLNGLDLSGLDFTGATLQGARLNKTNLTGATLDNATLDQAWALEAKLDGASLKDASLFQVQLVGCSLREADLSGALAPANFTKCDLTGASFAGADLGADTKNQSMGLMRGDLTKVTAQGADFTGANMLRTVLEFADLRGARFDNANLATAMLAGANLDGASVAGADFTDADVTSTRLTGLSGDNSANIDAARNLGRAIRH